LTSFLLYFGAKGSRHCAQRQQQIALQADGYSVRVKPGIPAGLKAEKKDKP
jgi:hypothetical protein